ncbi:hypothetical protein RAJCM14343_4104 [Rhodococcus aetherivorans]|uniref:Uncharacterized protein n=1 Tax=Rhodococcus aetherivorans TaxID=191292 RepID=A0ABQ0YQU4_9NOCA|nr:hypothetical protein RAJCM14343_4104 [Rhodococcus aetherivorans]CCW11935.1 hypothetical protein EBESD8_24790 [Rhodococcus aetherivorans]
MGVSPARSRGTRRRIPTRRVNPAHEVVRFETAYDACDAEKYPAPYARRNGERADRAEFPRTAYFRRNSHVADRA